MTIKFQKIRKHYDGAAAITDFNLDIQQGELVVLLGPSGSGKSTVLKMLNRMVSHDDGHIFFNGQDINSFQVFTGLTAEEIQTVIAEYKFPRSK